ncbi:MAG: DUF4271 domain-containing protein [Rikenellaceae bacterium]|nr:DUF4271 domain-containing protein [Rikenellaceae bacterium]MCL2693371.1 DUF4271 domain-containing protein [Rikenellaceae bacterium]
MTGNIYYSLAVLGCFVAFCLMVHFYRNYVLWLFGIFRGRATTERMLGEQGKIFTRFLTQTLVLGIAVTALAVLKFVDMSALDRLPPLDDRQAVAAIAGMTAVVAALWGFRYLLLKITGGLTRSQKFVARLFYLRKIVTAIGTVALLPVFLLFALSGGEAARVLGFAVAAIIAAAAILLTTRTLMFFVRQGFSISLWFLYLCAVEILPVSFLVIAAGRVFGNY